MRGCLPLEGGGQGKDRQSLEMSIRSVFFAGAEVDLHSAITKFPDILGESLQHSMMGKRIPLNYTSCKNYPSCKCVPVTACPSHVLRGNASSTFTCSFGKWRGARGTAIEASWLSGWGTGWGLRSAPTSLICYMFSPFVCIFPSQGSLQLLPQTWWSRSRGSTKNNHFPQLRLFTSEKLLSSLVAACQN